MVIEEHYWMSGNIELEVTDTTEGGWYDYRQKIDGKLKPWHDSKAINAESQEKH